MSSHNVKSTPQPALVEMFHDYIKSIYLTMNCLCALFSRGAAMIQTARNNRFFLTVLVVTLFVVSFTFSNLPSPAVTKSIQVINGTVFNFAEYPSLEHEQLALFNYINTLVTGQDYGSWTGWNAPEELHGLLHYVLAFMAYSTASLFESTPGYRTSQYRGFAYSLIKRMNTTFAEYGDQSIEYTEWRHPSYNFVDYYWPNATDPSGLYVGGFRGPANIMWTGHYALMMALYERNFNAGELRDELSWFIKDWNNSLTTDGHGNPSSGGIWGVGLIPCEPYIVFVQCNSIPIYCTRLFDSMYNMSYFESGMWDFGLNFINTVMQDPYGLFADGYYVMQPIGYRQPSQGPPQTFPGLSLDRYINDGRPKSSSYCNAWALTFLECVQPDETRRDYPLFMSLFSREVSNDKMYIIDTYNNPRGFGMFDILGSLFTTALAKQQGDFATVQRILNFLYNSYNKVWSSDGRQMYYDTSATLPFFQIPLAFGKIWATTPVTVKELATARSPSFWNYPYISDADDERIWIYQAIWDPIKSGFILNIRVDQKASLLFKNFDHTPTAYVAGTPLGQLLSTENGHVLILEPGTYNIVII